MFSLTPSALLIALLALAFPLSTAQDAGLRGTTPAVDCNKLLEMKIRCKEGDCKVPSTGPSVDLKFGVRIKALTNQEWQLVEAVMAAGSIVKPFETLKLPANRTVALNVTKFLNYVIPSKDVIGNTPILMGSAVLVNNPGRECSIQATYRQGNSTV